MEDLILSLPPTSLSHPPLDPLIIPVGEPLSDQLCHSSEWLFLQPPSTQLRSSTFLFKLWGVWPKSVRKEKKMEAERDVEGVERVLGV